MTASNDARFARVAGAPFFNVWPRYTPGTPALVRDQTAQHVMRSELAVYEDMIRGLYGPAKKAEAKKLGLRGIVEETWEFRGILMYRDLLTGETGAKPVCKVCNRRHAVGKFENGGDSYELHPDELRHHPEKDTEYWSKLGIGSMAKRVDD
jgi:hypothetical protein